VEPDASLTLTFSCSFWHFAAFFIKLSKPSSSPCFDFASFAFLFSSLQISFCFCLASSFCFLSASTSFRISSLNGQIFGTCISFFFLSEMAE
jgi:hypothetical protein